MRDGMVRLALCQRILPEFRVPVWRRLASEEGIDLTVFCGGGYGKGSTSGAADSEGFRIRRLVTLPIIRSGRYRVLHPGLVNAVLSGDFDVVLCEGLTYFPNSLALAAACRVQGIPFLLYEAPPVSGESAARRLLSPLYRRLATGVVTYSSWGARYFRERGVPEARITVAMNTVDTDLVTERLAAFSSDRVLLEESLGLSGRFVAGYIGGLEERKRPELLLEAVLDLARLGLPVTALLIGDGPMRKRLEGMVPPEYSRCVVFAGRRLDDAERYLQLCSVLVLPSQGGLAVPHALTCGVPCIVTEEAEGPGIRDYVTDGENGLVLPTAPSVPELSSLLRSLYEDAPELDRLAAGALASKDRFTVGRMVSALAEAAVRAADITDTAAGCDT